MRSMGSPMVNSLAEFKIQYIYNCMIEPSIYLATQQTNSNKTNQITQKSWSFSSNIQHRKYRGLVHQNRKENNQSRITYSPSLLILYNIFPKSCNCMTHNPTIHPQSMQKSPQATQFQFYQMLKHHPFKTLKLVKREQSLMKNNIIRKHMKQFNTIRYHIYRDMTTLMIFIKLCTVAAHFRLSLALSVPRNFITRTIKYMVVPGIVTYLLNRKNYNMAIENAEELKNQEIQERFLSVINKKTNKQ